MKFTTFAVTGLIILLCSNCKKDKMVPVVANSNSKTVRLLDSISGTATVAGIHNREPNATPEVWTDSIHMATGKFPGLWSGDFLFQSDNINNRQIMIDEAIVEWSKGALVNIMWHACNPALAEPCGYDSDGVLSHMTDAQWQQLLTDGTAINKKWKQMMDEVCIYLQQLKDAHVEVLWRPLHEMNQSAFWWGGRPGATGTKRLYQQMHDYMTLNKGLTNLIWVWDLQDFNTLNSDLAAFNPGDNYWDVAALDIYDQSGYSTEKYEAMVNAAHGKPVAIGECEVLPTAAQLSSQPKWVFFMSWSELTFQGNTLEQLTNLYHAPNVITLDAMPGWK